MAKQIIRLTESDLHNIIRESVRRVLREEEEPKYTEADLDKDENGNYIETTKEYTIREKKENLPGIKYDGKIIKTSIYLDKLEEYLENFDE